MKSIKSLITAITLLVFLPNILAQNTTGKTDDFGRIVLSVYIPQQEEGIKEAARNVLANKINQIITKYGFGGEAYNERFIITSNIVVLSKDLTSTAPAMTSLTLDISLFIGDGVDGLKFSSTTIQAKGVGTNETKAYIDAIKTINTDNPMFTKFLEEGKNKILVYYNSKCDYIIKEAKLLASQNNFDEAIYKLMAIPDACKDCYEKAIAAVTPIYQQKIDIECKTKLNQASNLWSANMDMKSANQAGELLSSVVPSASCFKDVQTLFTKVQQRALEINNREWDYKLTELNQKGDIIKTYRDVGVAYGNGQPKNITYNILGWPQVKQQSDKK